MLQKFIKNSATKSENFAMKAYLATVPKLSMDLQYIELQITKYKILYCEICSLIHMTPAPKPEENFYIFLLLGSESPSAFVYS